MPDLLIASRRIFPINKRLKKGTHLWAFNSCADFKNCNSIFINYLLAYSAAIHQSQNINITWQEPDADINKHLNGIDISFTGPSKFKYGYMISAIKYYHDKLHELENLILEKLNKEAASSN